MWIQLANAFSHAFQNLFANAFMFQAVDGVCKALEYSWQYQKAFGHSFGA